MVSRQSEAQDLSRKDLGHIARENMISQQLMTNRIIEPWLLEAVKNLPRERFVPEHLQAVAYLDKDIVIANDRSAEPRLLLEPLVQTRLIQLAEIGSKDRVLDIACGSGYSTALIASHALEVFAVEHNELLAARANNNLRALGCKNASVVIGPLLEGFNAQAPYAAIVINGGLDKIPASLEAQLAEGGRIVFIRQGSAGAAVARIALGIKAKGTVTYRDYFDTSPRLLPGVLKGKHFTF